MQSQYDDIEPVNTVHFYFVISQGHAFSEFEFYKLFLSFMWHPVPISREDFESPSTFITPPHCLFLSQVKKHKA